MVGGGGAKTAQAIMTTKQQSKNVQQQRGRTTMAGKRQWLNNNYGAVDKQGQSMVEYNGSSLERMTADNQL